MCDWLEESRSVASRMNGRPVLLAFAPELLFKKNPLEAIEGCCLECGRQLDYSEMFSPGRPPRYMCQRCYKALVHEARRGQCLLCHRVLPKQQQRELQWNPRELKNAFCQEQCLDYHKILAGRVLGVSFNLEGFDRLQRPKQIYPVDEEQRQIGYDKYNQLMIDGQPIRRLPQLGGRRK